MRFRRFSIQAFADCSQVKRRRSKRLPCGFRMETVIRLVNLRTDVIDTAFFPVFAASHVPGFIEAKHGFLRRVLLLLDSFNSREESEHSSRESNREKDNKSGKQVVRTGTTGKDGDGRRIVRAHFNNLSEEREKSRGDLDSLPGMLKVTRPRRRAFRRGSSGLFPVAA